MIEKTNFAQNKYKDRFYLKVYNYETMQLVKDLTPVGYELEDFKCFDVSDDGRYLAALNEGKSYLKIWDLETQELIKNKQLYDSGLSNPKDYTCEVQDIEFSSIDNDLIYYSGYFPNKENLPIPNGVFNYSHQKNAAHFVDINKKYPQGIFLLFDNDNRIALSSGVDISILNLKTNTVEFNDILKLEYPFVFKILFSKRNELFIGFSGSFIGSLKYNIISDSGQSILSNEIGLFTPQNNNLNINISSVPVGHYLLRIYSDREEFIFNIIKE